MNNIVPLFKGPPPHASADELLQIAAGLSLATVLIVGRHECGRLYVASSLQNKYEIIALLMTAQQEVVDPVEFLPKP